MRAVPEHEALARGVAHVSMTPEEAEHLEAALDAACARLRGLITNVLANRMNPDYAKREAWGLRAQLEILEQFHKAHRQAHGL